MGAIGSIVSDFAAMLWQWLVYIPKYLSGVLVGVLDALKYYVNLVFLKIVNPFFDLLISLLDGSGMTGYVSAINTAVTGGLGYYLDLMHVPQAITSAVAAYLVRFLIRRLPVVG